LDFAEAVDNSGNNLILFYPVRRKLWGAMGIESFPGILWMDFGGYHDFHGWTPPKTWRAMGSYPLYKRFPSTGFAGACYYAEVVSHPYFPVRLSHAFTQLRG